MKNRIEKRKPLPRLPQLDAVATSARKRVFVVRKITFYKDCPAPNVWQQLVSAEIGKKEIVKRYIVEPALEKKKKDKDTVIQVGSSWILYSSDVSNRSCDYLVNDFLDACEYGSTECSNPNWKSACLRVKTGDMIEDYSIYERTISEINPDITAPVFNIKVVGLNDDYEKATLYEATLSQEDLIHDYDLKEALSKYWGTKYERSQKCNELFINDVRFVMNYDLKSILLHMEEDYAAIRLVTTSHCNKPLHHKDKKYKPYTELLNIFDNISESVTEVLAFYKSDKEGNVLFNTGCFFEGWHYNVFEKGYEETLVEDEEIPEPEEFVFDFAE